MNCSTIKEGNFCTFMKAAGCSFNGGQCRPVVDQCQGCAQIKEYSAGQYCLTYGNPDAKWKIGSCSFATHLKQEKVSEKKLNPLKASKRGQA
jgi:hypothetical protein